VLANRQLTLPGEVPKTRQLTLPVRRYKYLKPALMMAAFGIELFLKSLSSKCVYHAAALGGFLVTAQPMKKGHSLGNQFDELSPELQVGLEQTYSKRPVVANKDTIREALAAYDGLFVSTRYSFEDKGNDNGRSITDLVRLLDLIGDHVDSLVKRVFFK
jgi:hypothetical protein